MIHSNSLENFDSTKFNHLVPPDFHTEKYKEELNNSIDPSTYKPVKFVDQATMA